MRSVSRASLAEARERLEAVLSSADPAVLGDELFAVLHLLDQEAGLRRALSDPSRDGEQKAQVAQVLLEGKMSAAGLGLVADIVALRWARPGELADAVEQLAVIAEVARTEAAGQLDDLEDELFRFGRIVDAQPELRAALADPARSADHKRELLDTLLAGKATPSTHRLVTEVATRPRGRSLDRGLVEYAGIAAQRRQRLVAVVRTAVELTEEQKSRLAAALAASYGHAVHLNIERDPDVLGGISIRIGDEEIDGTIAGRLADVRRRLAS